jgi:flagella basal body P-ring formation protein FlgA
MLRRFRLVALVAGLAIIGLVAPALAQEMGVIPTRVIYPGETIDPGALKMAKVRKNRTSPVKIAHSYDQLAGKVARRTLLSNRFVPLDYVRDAYVVEPGKPVHVELVQGAMTISIAAVTLEAGSTGDTI